MSEQNNSGVVNGQNISLDEQVFSFDQKSFVPSDQNITFDNQGFEFDQQSFIQSEQGFGFGEQSFVFNEQNIPENSSFVNGQSISVSAQTIANSVEVQDMEELKAKLTKQLKRDRIILILLSVVTVIVFIARIVL